jgi:dihydroxyacid dehydratase/phosphogluconate dehydratase
MCVDDTFNQLILKACRLLLEIMTLIPDSKHSLPGSSSNPAESPAKMRECMKAAETIKICMEKNIRPRDLMTKESFENALVMTMALGGSTNGVLHFLAMAGIYQKSVSELLRC